MMSRAPFHSRTGKFRGVLGVGGRVSLFGAAKEIVRPDGEPPIENKTRVARLLAREARAQIQARHQPELNGALDFG